jgi:ABC-type transport system substrate-binding protein
MFEINRPQRRGVRGALVAAALATATFALPAAAAAATLTIAATAGPTTLDPTTSSNGIPSVWFPNLTYAALIWRAPDGQAKPGLAVKWAYSEDRLSFVMDLREGVKFSDGSPMTAADVVNWLKHYKEKGSFTAWLAKVTD